MRIAQVAPIWVRVPPPTYGGIELVVSLLADGLVRRGHDVTLFATGDSLTTARLSSTLPVPPALSEMGRRQTDEVVHSVAAYLQADEFDVIHDHTALGPALGAVLRGGPPVVHTLHGPWTADARALHEALRGRIELVAISRAQAGENSALDYAGVVHNGVAPQSFPYRADKEDFALFLGRCNPEKGPEVAVEVARRAGLPLTMVIKRSEPEERAYWDAVVAPRLTGEETIIFDADQPLKNDLLSRAKVTLFPIQWSEPFGLVMIESLACGTPVIATPRGSAPEIVVDGATGFLRADVDAMVEATRHLGDIDPAACRARVEEHFSAERMVDGYEAVYERVLAGPTATRAAAAA